MVLVYSTKHTEHRPGASRRTAGTPCPAWRPSAPRSTRRTPCPGHSCDLPVRPVEVGTPGRVVQVASDRARWSSPRLFIDRRVCPATCLARTRTPCRGGVTGCPAGRVVRLDGDGLPRSRRDHPDAAGGGGRLRRGVRDDRQRVVAARGRAAALTVSGHKLGGPVGVGALLLGRDVACVPLLHGGGQERDVRSGTLDVPGIVAFATAVEVSVKAQVERAYRLAALRDELIARVRAAVPEAVLNGDPVDRLPGNAHFSFPGCECDALLLLLDAAGVACSTGSACSAGVAQPSHVLLAMGADESRARSSLRFTLGHTSTSADIEELVAALPGAVERARRAGVAKSRR